MAVPGEYPRNDTNPMRIAAFGFSLAPLALLSTVGLQSNAYPAYPTVGYAEPMTCAAAGDNRMLRAALGCPIYYHVTSPVGVVVGPESIACAAVGNDRILRAALGCPMY